MKKSASSLATPAPSGLRKSNCIYLSFSTILFVTLIYKCEDENTHYWTGFWRPNPNWGTPPFGRNIVVDGE